MEFKTVDKKGLDFIANEEGIRLKPYLDSVGMVTIGIGSTYYENMTIVRMTDPPISKTRALALFKNLLNHYELAVWSSTRDDITQNQFNALTSLTYNIGVSAFKSSTLLKLVNENPYTPLIRNAFLAWKRAGKKDILLPRREREANLYFS